MNPFNEEQTDEIVGDAMVSLETVRYNATRRYLTHVGKKSMPALSGWDVILLWVPMSESALFASANGL